MKGSSRGQSRSYWGVSVREEGEHNMQKQERSNVNTWSLGMLFTPGRASLTSSKREEEYLLHVFSLRTFILDSF